MQQAYLLRLKQDTAVVTIIKCKMRIAINTAIVEAATPSLTHTYERAGGGKEGQGQHH
jgi:protoheme ferro-lyase